MALSSKFNLNSLITNTTEVKQEIINTSDPVSQSLNTDALKIEFTPATYNLITLLYKAELVFALSFYKNVAKEPIAEADLPRVCPINNFIFDLFSSMTLFIQEQEIEKIQNLYYPLSMMKMLTKTRDKVDTEGIIESNILDAEFDNTNSNTTNKGWMKRNNRYISKAEVDGPKRHCVVTLKLDDVFGFFKDFRKPLMYVKMKVVLERKVTDNATKFMFYNNGANVGYVEIDKIQLRVPQQILEIKYQTEFESQFKGDKEITMLFNKRRVDIPTIQGKGLQSILIRPTKNPPEYMIITLLEDPLKSEFNINNGLFITTNHTTVGEVTTTTYSTFFDDIEGMSLDFGDNIYYPSAGFKEFDKITCIDQYYKEYRDLSYRFGHSPQLSAFEFKHNYPFVVFDLHKHPRHLFVGDVNLYLRVTFKDTNTKTYRIYCLSSENFMYKGILTAGGISNLTDVKFSSIMS